NSAQSQVSGSGSSTLDLGLVQGAGAIANLMSGTLTYADSTAAYLPGHEPTIGSHTSEYSLVGFTQTISGFQHIFDTTSSDWLIGDSTANQIESGAGNDLVQAGGGDDVIVGGSGPGDDVYDGGEGNNTVTYTSTVLGVIVDLSASSNNATGP